MKPSQQSYTFDELKRAASRAAEEFKSQLAHEIQKKYLHGFNNTKDSLSDMFRGMRYLGIYLLESVQMDEFSEFVRSLEKELEAINWPEKSQ